MSAPIRRFDPAKLPESTRCTLLELVSAVSEAADSEQEVVATVLHMLRSGRVELCGTLRHLRYEDFLR